MQTVMEDLCSGLDRLWDWNLTWYSSDPELTQCFQQTVLVWSPCVFLWSCTPLYLLYLSLRHPRPRLPLSRLCCCKTLLALSLVSFGLLEIFYLLAKRNGEVQKNLLLLVSPSVRSFTLVLAVVLIHVERVKGTRSSVLLFLFWTLMVLCTLFPLKEEVQHILRQGVSADPLRTVALCIWILLQITEFILSCFSDTRRTKTTPTQNVCPEEEASFLSRFFFFWFSSLVVQGYRRPLQAGDLWTLREEDSSKRIMEDLEKLCRQRSRTRSMSPSNLLGSSLPSEKTQLLAKPSTNHRHQFSIVSALGRSFGPYFLCATLCLLLHDAVMFSIPQVLRLLLDFMADREVALWKGVLFAVLLFLLSCLQSLLHHQFMFHCFTVGMRLKTAVMGLVYRKSLVMSSSAQQQCTLGEIISLLSVDVQKLMDFVVYFNSTWMAPLEITLCFCFLWQLLGPPSLAGISAIILIFPLNAIIAKMRSILQEVQLRFMDGRIQLMNEVLGGMKILKLFCWEEVFLRKVVALRDGELGALRSSQILQSVSLASFSSSPFLVALSVFSIYVLTDDNNVLDAQKIFVSITLINILKTPLSQLPFALSTALQAVVSLRRLQTFLNQDELKTNNVDRSALSKGAAGVVIEGGYFSWSSAGPPTLQRINVTVKKGALLVVVGHVASGKSSLLSAMLGEMELLSGSVFVEGSVAYVPQQAWIQNASLKENVLFGMEKKDSWYHRVLEACALLPDLDLLPAGENTQIGEKGLNLSGGQRQRVSLARAVYRRSDVYLLDDPLSAVDAQVGQHIFDRVIGPRGLLKDKTRILVTHGLGFLSKADLVLVMEDGQISEMGSYLDLMDRRGTFSKLIHSFTGSQRRENSLRDRGSRRSLSHLSVTDFSIDLSQEQLISCDVSSASVQLIEGLEDFETDDAGKLTEADRARTGRVKLHTYRSYFSTVGPTFIMTIIFLCAFQQAASLAYSYWLSLWADEAPTNGTQPDHHLRLSVFAALGFTQGAALFGTTLAISLGGIVASQKLHTDLLNSVLHSPMSFFEATPSGNLLNRFSKEVDAIDCMIPEGLKMMLSYLFKLLEVCIIVLLATPLSGLVILPLTCFYAFIQSFYVASSCQLRRLEAVSRSPIYSHFNETVQGASIVRAFGEQQRFILQADYRIDRNQEAYFPRFVATRWLAVNLEFLGNLLVLAAAILCVCGRGELSPGVVGLAVSHSLQVTGVLSWIVRSWTDVENNIVSVERVKEYDHTPKEAPWTLEGHTPPESWPSAGTIHFENYGLQYFKGLDWALKDISIQIQEGEKVGIVGRTGAGKSTLVLAVFRILESTSGQILIDGIDISTIGLHHLRSRITIIPQEPVLFTGSLRMNLDPFDVSSDEDLWKALALVNLSSFVSTLPHKLDHPCSEGGQNLSVGQRQLLCLARALLRRSRILILDEATAAMDMKTDQLVQSTLRSQFNDCTVLTITHRLHTIMDYSRVVVMDQGQILEVDSPSQLLALQGHFYQMCLEAGLI